MMLEGLFKRLVDGVDVVYNFWNVPISGVFAFDELELSSSLVGRVFDKFEAGFKCLPNRLDEVRPVVCRSIVYRKDVFWYMVCFGSIVFGLSSCRPSCSGCGIG